MRAPSRLEPPGERQEISRHRPKGADRLDGLPMCPGREQTSHNRLLMHVQTCAVCVEYLHRRLLLMQKWWWNDLAGHPAQMNLLRVLFPEGRRQMVVPEGARIQLVDGLAA